MTSASYPPSSQKPSAASVGMIPALDGIRGLSILLIVFTHMHLFGLGWIGVQVFFVLSGFLITRLLLRDAEAQSFGPFLKNFYIRRALRIFPAFYLYLAGLTAVALLFEPFAPIRQELPFVASYTSNFYMTTTLEPAASRANWMLAHLWSLCIEEHFYLLWPAVVYWAGRDRLPKLALALIVAGPFVRIAIHQIWPMLPWPNLSPNVARVIYVLTPSHIDAFATGALASMRPARPMGNRTLLGFGVAVFCLFAAGAAVNGIGIYPDRQGQPFNLGFPIHLAAGWQYAWGYSGINLLSAWLVLMAVHQPQIRRFFSMRWLRYTGKISYGMYILHLGLIAALVTICEQIGISLDSPFVRLLAAPFVLLALYAIAAVSYRYYEEPFLRMKDRWSSSGPRTPRPLGAAAPSQHRTD